MSYSGLKKIFGVYNIKDKINDYNDIVKSEQESKNTLDALAEEYTIRQAAYDQRNNFDAQERKSIEKRYDSFMKGYISELSKERKKLHKTKEKREKLFKDTELSKAIWTDKIFTALEKVQKSGLNKAHKDKLCSDILKESIKKGRVGFYKNNYSNRRQGVVGMGYGTKHIKGGEVKEDIEKKEPTGKEKVEKVMREFKEGTLKDSHG